MVVLIQAGCVLSCAAAAAGARLNLGKVLCVQAGYQPKCLNSAR